MAAQAPSYTPPLANKEMKRKIPLFPHKIRMTIYLLILFSIGSAIGYSALTLVKYVLTDTKLQPTRNTNHHERKST